MSDLKIRSTPSPRPNSREVDVRPDGAPANEVHAPSQAVKLVIIALNIVSGTEAEPLPCAPAGAAGAPRTPIPLPSNFSDVKAELVSIKGEEFVRTSGQFGDEQWYRASSFLRAPGR